MKNKEQATDETTMLHIRMPKTVHTEIVKANAKEVAKSGKKKTLSDTGLNLLQKGLSK
jgi:hypothetical protein